MTSQQVSHGEGIECPFCNSDLTKVTDSRPTQIILLDGKRRTAIRRRRQCLNRKCLRRFTTLETYYSQIVQ